MQFRRLQQQGRDARQNRTGGQGHCGLCISGDSLQPPKTPVWAWRVGGHCDSASIETAKKSCDIVESGGIEQQNAFAPRYCLLEQRADLPCPLVQFGEGEGDFFVLSVSEERIDSLMW